MHLLSISRVWKAAFISMVALILSWPLSAQNLKVGGVVKDNAGETLAGAIVVVQGKAEGGVKNTVTTDIDGKFSLECDKNDYLVVHYLGYQSLTEKVNGRAKVELVLLPDAAQSLEESVVIGYGSVKKADLTGSVTNVKMNDIKDVPVSSIDQALQGRIAGADFMSTSGEPGATTSIRIRGTRSITASNEPLYVVDGVMDAITDLNDLNSADIETVTVLKDASSTAIYGSKGSNGVIIVTTKSGSDSHSLKPNITLKTEAGFSMLPSKLDIMTGPEFALYRTDYYAYSTNQPEWADISMNTPVSQTIYKDPINYAKGTDWIGEITRVAPYQNYLLSASGNNDNKTKYYASLGFNDNQGIIKKSGQWRLTGSFSIEHQMFKWLRLGYKMNYTYRHNDENLTSIGGTTWYSSAMYLSPMLRPNDVENPLYYGSQRYNSPTALLEQNTYFTKRLMNTNTGFAEIKFNKYLKFRSQNTYYVFQRDRYRYYPSTLPKKTEGQGGDAYRESLNEIKLTTENTLTFDRTWSKTHHVDAVAGFTGYHYRVNSFSLSGSGYLNDSVLWNNMNAVVDKETYSASTNTTQINKLSGYARLNYNYKSRYYITMTGRADGSSNFAANKKWGFFPSGALKWNVAKEPWMRQFRWIEDLSLRASYGVTGNDAISAYRSLEALTSTTSGYLFNGSQPVAYYPSRLESPDLTWEKTGLGNIALDASFFRGRLSTTLELYSAVTNDLLLDVQVADQTGFSSRKTNIGRTTNKGIEFSLETRNIVKKNFSWDTSFTISHNDQMVEDIGTEDFVKVYGSPGNNSYMMYGYVKGYPLNSLWGFKYQGVWHNQEEIDRNKVTHTYASQTIALTTALGAPKYLDMDHNGTLSQNDLQYLGNADPYLYGGLQNNFRYKNFTLGVFFAYSLGGKIYNFAELYMSGSTFTNQYRYMLDAWHPVRNPNSNYARSGIVSDVHVPSSFQVHDASYLRFKTLTAGYTFRLDPKKYFIKDIRLSMAAENVYLWKSYNGFDPDVSTESDGNLIRRMDLGAYPKPRTVIFSVQVRY